MQYAKDPKVDRSLRHSVRDGMANSAMVGSAETYLSALALFFRASASQVALLATLPALLGALGQIFSVWLNRNGGRRKPLIVAGTVLQALVWIPLLLMVLWLPDAVKPLQLSGYAVPWLLILITLYFFCGQLTAPLWTSLMGDLVPEKRRGRFFGARTRLTTIASFSGLVIGGMVLHIADVTHEAAWGFAILFGFAFLARMKSAWHLSRMHEPPRTSAAPPVRIDRQWLSEARTSGALSFSGYVVLMQAAVAVSGPLFTVYMLNQLGFSYLQLMLATGGSVLVQFLTMNYWGRIADVFGSRLILSVSSVLVPLLPALWLVSDNFWLLFAAQCLGGLAWGGFTLSSTNLMFELVPSAQRATYSAFHSILAAVGIFAGGMLGAALFKVLPDMSPILNGGDISTPLISVFIVSALLRMLVVLCLLRRVREARSPRRRLTARAFIFRVTRFDAFLGLAYEVVTSFRRRGVREPEQVTLAPASAEPAPSVVASTIEPATELPGRP